MLLNAKQKKRRLFYPLLKTGLFLVAIILFLFVCQCDEPLDLDSHKALLKAAGSEDLTYCFWSTDAFFFSYSLCATTG